MDHSKDLKRPHMTKEPQSTKAESCVGFDALPEQVVNRAVQTGFCFNILCVGEPGIGKTTLLESLFAIQLNDKPCDLKKTPGLQKRTFILTEGNVRLRVCLIETAGYGDQIDKSDCFRPISEYIDAQFCRTMNNELKICRRNQPLESPPEDDTCVHACLYFIEPTGHSLKTLDLITLQNLDSKVNLVPIISKADTLSKTELAYMRETVSKDLENVRLYRWPIDDENVASTNTKMNEMMPFAVVGSSDFVKVGNKSVRGRQYPWGVVQVENDNHCDFVRLREMLLRTNMFDLIETTHSVHYELYRFRRLESLGFKADGERPIELFEDRRHSLRQEYEQKEVELKNQFIERVKKKEAELRKIEDDVHSELNSYKQWYKEQREMLEVKLNNLNEEISSFESGRRHSNRFASALGRKLKR